MRKILKFKFLLGLFFVNVMGVFFFTHGVKATSPSSQLEEQNNVKKLVLLGDSITEGIGVSKETTYGALIQEKLKKNKKNWIVINSGISGSTSASIPSRMKWVLKGKPDLIVLAIGANDALRGLKLEVTKKNILESVELAQKANVKVIIAGMLTPPNYGKKYSQDFAQLYQDVAKQTQAKLIPFLLEGVAGHSEFNIADGIHPNEKGHQKISEIVYKAIEEYL